MFKMLAKAILIGVMRAVQDKSACQTEDLSVKDANGYLPPGVPVVTLSPRALEMRSEAFAIRETKVETVGPRPGSYAWRVEQEKGLR